MNACIRAVVRTALYHKLEVYGIKYGYDGMINGDYIPLENKSVANIIQHGGTILKTARSKDFMTDKGMLKAKVQLEKNLIDGVIAIGGDGTFKGAEEFGKICTIPFIGIPGTIDNDLFGTDYTIGYDTAINTVIEAVDKIRDTAESHNRLFFVEVMGRDAGLIALRSGIGSGAESIIIPETKTDLDSLVAKLRNSRKDKTSKIIMVAEGDEAGGAFEIANKIKEKIQGYDMRITVLGHVQRGGSPTCMDRVNASRLGYSAVEALVHGKKSVMAGIVDRKVIFTPFSRAVKYIDKIYPDLINMMEVLSL